MSRAIVILASVAILALLHCPRGTAAHENVVLVKNPTDGKLVVITKWLDGQSGTYKCSFTSNPSVVEEVKKGTSDDQIIHPSAAEMEMAKMECEETLKRKRRDARDQDAESERGFDLIFPGTKWCGDGDIAENDDDLGEEADTDRCCRAHDKCDDIMDAKETKHNLTNDSPFTSLSCKCDNAFYKCLSKVNNVPSNTIGNSYFNILRRECYQKDYPFTSKCKEYRTFLKLSCIEYERDTSKPKVYQWVSAKFYNQMPLSSYFG